MTSWSVLTLVYEEQGKITENVIHQPTGLEIDSGIDEQGLLEDEQTYYALSYGRYQNLALEQHLENMKDGVINVLNKAFVAEVNDTDDNVEVSVFERVNGELRGIEKFTGKRWPDEDREEFLEMVESEIGCKPVIEPVDTIAPPDAVVMKEE